MDHIAEAAILIVLFLVCGGLYYNDQQNKQELRMQVIEQCALTDDAPTCANQLIELAKKVD